MAIQNVDYFDANSMFSNRKKKKKDKYMYFKKHVKVIRENVLSLATFIILENFN
jgi:hypothetical protein